MEFLIFLLALNLVVTLLVFPIWETVEARSDFSQRHFFQTGPL